MNLQSELDDEFQLPPLLWGQSLDHLDPLDPRLDLLEGLDHHEKSLRVVEKDDLALE